MQHPLQELCNESVPISCRSCAVRRSAGAAHVGSPRDANPPRLPCRRHRPAPPHPPRRPRPHDPARLRCPRALGRRFRLRRRTLVVVAVTRRRRGRASVRSGATVRSRSPPGGGPGRAARRAGPRAVRGCGRVRGLGRLHGPCRHAPLRSLACDPPPARDDRRPAGRRGPGGRAAGHGGRVGRAPRPPLRRPPGGRTVRLRRSAALPRTRRRTGATAGPSPTPNPDPQPSATTPTIRPPPTRRTTPRRRAPPHRRAPSDHRPPPGHGFEPRCRVRPRRRVPLHRRAAPGHGPGRCRRARARGFESARSVAGVGGAGAGAGGRRSSVARRRARAERLGSGGDAATGTLTR
jgi:hypothetical protein